MFLHQNIIREQKYNFILDIEFKWYIFCYVFRYLKHSVVNLILETETGSQKLKENEVTTNYYCN